MRGLKFSTIANASGFAILTKGRDRALADQVACAYGRLQHVSGLTPLEVGCRFEPLPRTGDNIAMRVVWQTFGTPMKVEDARA